MQDNNEINNNQQVQENTTIETPKKNNHIVLIIVLIVVAAVVGFFVLIVMNAKKNVDSIFDKAKLSTFVMEVKNVYYESQTEWTTSSNGYEAVYATNNGIKCDNYLKSNNWSSNVNYYIKISSDGRMEKLIVTDGTYGYKYEGDNLEASDIIDADVKLLSESNITIPSCN